MASQVAASCRSPYRPFRPSAACAKFGFLFVAKLYFVPYWINVAWLDVVTYLHHTDKEVSQDRERSAGHIKVLDCTRRLCLKASATGICALLISVSICLLGILLDVAGVSRSFEAQK